MPLSCNLRRSSAGDATVDCEASLAHFSDDHYYARTMAATGTVRPTWQPRVAAASELARATSHERCRSALSNDPTARKR
jgi:hypothetical protein